MQYLGMDDNDLKKLNVSDESYKQTRENFQAIEKEFIENSDRGISIISASMLEQCLYTLLKSFMTERKSNNEDNLLFKNNGALSNFNNKIEMAYRLALISESDKKMLNIIRKIRNIFAHQISEISFESKEIIEQCKKLQVPKDMIVPLDLNNIIDSKLVVYKVKNDDYKGIFKEATYMLIDNLAVRHMIAILNQRGEAKEFKNINDKMKITLDIKNIIKDMIEQEILKEHKSEIINSNKLSKYEKSLDDINSHIEFFENLDNHIKNMIIKDN